MAPDAPARGGSRRLLLIAFGTVAVLCTLGTAVALRHTASVEQHAAGTVDNALQSIRILSHISRDLDQERILVNEHVFQRQLPAMITLEERIAALASDRAVMSINYEPLVSAPGEREAWERVRNNVAKVEPIITEAMALSRN